MVIKYVASASNGTGDYTADGSGDQAVINQALAWADGAGTAASKAIVYLKGPFDFGINNKVYIGNNTHLTGDKTACMRVENHAVGTSSSNVVFPNGTPVIGSLHNTLSNVEISQIEIDGNCQNQSNTLGTVGGRASSAGTGIERMIGFYGSSGYYFDNISIHDIHCHDSFGETLHIFYGRNVKFYNNKCENNQHDSVFYVCASGTGNQIYNNTIQGITSDCIRCDSCQNVDIFGNYLTPYLGSNNNGAAEHGENGIQIGDGSGKPIHTNNINIYNNSIINQGIAGIWLSGVEVANASINIHDNTLKDNGWSCWVNYCAGISIDGWGNGIVIEGNSIDGSYQDGIQVMGARDTSSNYIVAVRNNSITNTRGKRAGSTGSTLPSSAIGYGIYNAYSSNAVTVQISGNTFDGNLTGSYYGNIKTVASTKDYIKVGLNTYLHANEPEFTDNSSLHPISYVALHASEPFLKGGYDDLKPQAFIGMYASTPTFYTRGSSSSPIVPGTKGLIIPTADGNYVFIRGGLPNVGSQVMMYPAGDGEYYLIS